jgi:hypothetical protein
MEGMSMDDLYGQEITCGQEEQLERNQESVVAKYFDDEERFCAAASEKWFESEVERISEVLRFPPNDILAKLWTSRVTYIERCGYCIVKLDDGGSNDQDSSVTEFFDQFVKSSKKHAEICGCWSFIARLFYRIGRIERCICCDRFFKVLFSFMRRPLEWTKEDEAARRLRRRISDAVELYATDRLSLVSDLLNRQVHACRCCEAVFANIVSDAIFGSCHEKARVAVSSNPDAPFSWYAGTDDLEITFEVSKRHGHRERLLVELCFYGLADDSSDDVPYVLFSKGMEHGWYNVAKSEEDRDLEDRLPFPPPRYPQPRVCETMDQYMPKSFLDFGNILLYALLEEVDIGAVTVFMIDCYTSGSLHILTKEFSDTIWPIIDPRDEWHRWDEYHEVSRENREAFLEVALYDTALGFCDNYGLCVCRVRGEDSTESLKVWHLPVVPTPKLWEIPTKSLENFWAWTCARPLVTGGIIDVALLSKMVDKMKNKLSSLREPRVRLFAYPSEASLFDLMTKDEEREGNCCLEEFLEGAVDQILKFFFEKRLEGDVFKNRTIGELFGFRDVEAVISAVGEGKDFDDLVPGRPVRVTESSLSAVIAVQQLKKKQKEILDRLTTVVSQLESLVEFCSSRGWEYASFGDRELVEFRPRQ